MKTSTNGSPLRVALYARASTEEQAYSIPGQLAELRDFARSAGAGVIVEIRDEDEKRWMTNRPGINDLMDRAAATEIDEVWAWEEKRYGDPPVPVMLAMMFEQHGVTLRYLVGDEDDARLETVESRPESEETRDRKRRAARGRKDKRLRGEVFGGFRARYGFRFVKGENQRGADVNAGYSVDPEKMANVLRIFEMLASGESIHAVQRLFEQGGIPNPSGKPQWSRTTIRNIVQDDVYRPRSFEEIERLVTPEIAATLDPSKTYGVSWSGRKRSKFKNHSSKKRVVYETPPEEWKAVPIDLTGSGLDRATIDRARDAIKDNKSTPKVGDRFWELSGVLKCAQCGRSMIAYSRKRADGSRHYYYRCRPSSTVDVCANRKSHRAEHVEDEVRDAVRRMVDDHEMLIEGIKEAYARKRRELEGPTLQVTPLVEKLADLDRRKEGYWTLAADGDMPKDVMRRKVSELDEQREGLETALDHARHRDERLVELNRREERLLAWVIEGSTRPNLIGPIHDTEGGTHTFGSIYAFMVRDMWAPEARRTLYLELGMRVEIDAEGRTTIDGTITPPSGASGTREAGEQKGALQTEHSSL